MKGKVFDAAIQAQEDVIYERAGRHYKSGYECGLSGVASPLPVDFGATGPARRVSDPLNAAAFNAGWFAGNAERRRLAESLLVSMSDDELANLRRGVRS